VQAHRLAGERVGDSLPGHGRYPAIADNEITDWALASLALAGRGVL
jgi:hypothetical protein